MRRMIALLLFVVIFFVCGCSTTPQILNDGKELCSTFSHEHKIYKIWVDPNTSPEMRQTICDWTEYTVKNYGPEHLKLEK